MTDPRYTIARDVEVAAWEDVYGAVPPAVRAELGLAVERIGGDSLLLCLANIEHPMLSRALLANGDAGTLAAAAERFRAAGVDRYFLQREKRADNDSPPAHLIPYRRNWVKLVGRVDVAAAPPVRCALPVRDARADEAPACGALFCDGFDIARAAAGLFAVAIEREGWRVFVAVDGDRVVGVSYMFARGAAAYLCGAVTAPSHRRRGIQGALLTRRLRAASELGCEWIVSETGEQVEGDPQHSQRNMQRIGLEVVGVTENIVAAGTVWNHWAPPRSDG